MSTYDTFTDIFSFNLCNSLRVWLALPYLTDEDIKIQSIYLPQLQS